MGKIQTLSASLVHKLPAAGPQVRKSTGPHFTHAYRVK